jgi:hypothetical protein
MVWYNPFSWGKTEPVTTLPPASTPPPTTTVPSVTGARRRTRHGRKGSKRYHSKRHRTGKKSSRL